MISAKIIADSLNTQGQRLTTFVLVFPRIVLAEFNTHRMFSRNSASSRAIPFKKMVEMVKTNPFIPIKWMKEHKGMQGNEYFDDDYKFEFPCTDKGTDINNHEYLWLKARDKAVKFASLLANEGGLTKQIVNRLLEPFMWHTVIVTTSDYENFFALRADEAAEIHIQDLAFKMLEEYNKSTPTKLKEGEWHIPFGDKFDEQKIKKLFKVGRGPMNIIEVKIQIATARCARVSYMNFEGKDDYEADIKLHDMLLKSGHMSPFEHCARAMSDNEYYSYVRGHYETGLAVEEDFNGWSGNFRGFIQYRKLFADENKIDNRVKK